MQEVTYPPDQGREDQAGKAFFSNKVFFLLLVGRFFNYGIMDIYILYVYFQFAWNACWKA